MANLTRFLRLLPALPHAVLLHGPKGTGKFEFARSAAALLLCNGPIPLADREQACGTCAACLLFAGGNHPDFHCVQPEADIVDGEEAAEAAQASSEKRKKPSTQIKIEQVRELIGGIQSGSHQGGLRVIVITPAEAMNSATANCLLKTLEEPPSQTVILLVSNEPERLLPTIRSRCQAIGFSEPDRQSSSAWLREQGVGDADLRLALYGGAPLAALESAGSGRDVRSLAERVAESADAMACADALSAMEPAVAVDWLQRWTCDLLLLRMGRRVRYHPSFEALLRPIARGSRLRQLFVLSRALCDYRRVSRHPVNARLYVELLAMDYFDCVGASGRENRSGDAMLGIAGR